MPVAAQRSKYFARLAGALDAAHAEGVVHRDLKSDNIMLLSSSGTDYAKVLDFGIAKIKEPEGAYDPALTAPDLVIGTPQYMSPEQCSPVAGHRCAFRYLFAGRNPLRNAGGACARSPVVRQRTIMLKHLQQPAPSVLDEGTMCRRRLAA